MPFSAAAGRCGMAIQTVKTTTNYDANFNILKSELL